MRHNRFGAPKIHDYMAGIDLLKRNQEYFARLVFILLEDDVALGVPQALHHHLLCRLRRDAPRLVGHALRDDDPANLGFRGYLARVPQRNLGPIVGYDVHHGFQHIDRDIAGAGVQLHGDILPGGDAVPSVGGRYRLFDSGKHAFLWKTALCCELRQGDDKIALRHTLTTS